MTLHNAFAVKYGTTVVSGLTQLDLQTNPNVESESSSGTPFPQFAVITSQDPRIMFATKQVGALLGVTGLVGAVIDGTNGMTAYFARLADNGIAASGAVHRTYVASRGLLVPRRLQCAARSHVQVDAEALLYSSDGAAYPLAIADNVALPATTQNNILHTIGPITLGITGTVINPNCIQNVSIDFGNGAGAVGCGGDLYNTHIEQPRVAPVITLTGIDAAVFGTGGVPPVGLPLAHTATKIFFRKRALSGIGFVPDGTAEHIKLTTNGIAVVKSHTGQGTDKAQVTLEITTAWDGTIAPLTINSASAIA